MPSLSTSWDLNDHPKEEELETALRKLKRGKAGGRSGILPEMILYGGAELWDRMLEFMSEVWAKEKVVQDWKPSPRRVTSASVATGMA